MHDHDREATERSSGEGVLYPVLLLAGVENDPGEDHIVRGID